MSFLGAFIVFLMFVVSLLLRHVHRNWLTPAAFYSLWWSVTTAISLIIGANESIPVFGLIWLLISCIVIGIGSLFFVSRENTKKTECLNYSKDRLYQANVYLIRTYWGALIIAFVYIWSTLNYNQIGFNDFKSIDNIFLVAAKFTTERYEESASLPLYIKLQLPFVFFSNSIGGLLYRISYKKRFLLCLIPPIIISLIFTEKAGIFFCLSAWTGSYFVIKLLLGELNLFSFKNLIRLSLFAVLIVIIITASSFSRLGTLDVSELSLVKDKLYSGFGQVPAFSNWFNNYNFFEVSFEFGKYTLSGILDLLGLSKREIGLYSENYQLSNGTLTNIYSIHKGLLLDFSIFGTLLLYFLFGIFSSFVYYKVNLNHVKYFSILSLCYFIIIGSIFTSILVYNTIFLSCLLTVFAFANFKLK